HERRGARPRERAGPISRAGSPRTHPNSARGSHLFALVLEYTPHSPEQTLLHRVVHEQLEPFPYCAKTPPSSTPLCGSTEATHRASRDVRSRHFSAIRRETNR